THICVAPRVSCPHETPLRIEHRLQVPHGLRRVGRFCGRVPRRISCCFPALTIACSALCVWLSPLTALSPCATCWPRTAPWLLPRPCPSFRLVSAPMFWPCFPSLIAVRSTTPCIPACELGIWVAA